MGILKKTGPINWKTNLAVIWISQILGLSAFYFCLPFFPLYLKEKGIVPEDQTAFWSGIFIAAAPVSMMIMSPIWGVLGDKYGRKMMLVRASVAGAFVLYLMALVDNIQALIALRLLQGAFTGTVPSAQSLVAAGTPEKHQGFALGLMMAAINASFTVGAYFGGIYAQHYGAESTFRMAGYLLAVSTVMVVTMVREDFSPPPRCDAATRSARIRRRKEGIRDLKSTVPAMFAIAFAALVMTFDGPFLALYVESLFVPAQQAGAAAGEVAGEVYRMTGSINALASIIAIGGSNLISYLMDKKMPRVFWSLLAVAGAVGIGFICWYPSIAGLTLGRSVFLFFLSGLSSVLVVLLSRMTPPHKKGSAMGWTVTARCIGWTTAPLLGGWLVQQGGYANTYRVLAGMCLLLAPVFFYLTMRYPEAFGRKVPEGEEEDMAVPPVLLPPQTLPITPTQSGSSVRMFLPEEECGDDEEEGEGRDA